MAATLTMAKAAVIPNYLQAEFDVPTLQWPLVDLGDDKGFTDCTGAELGYGSTRVWHKDWDHRTLQPLECVSNPMTVVFDGRHQAFYLTYFPHPTTQTLVLDGVRVNLLAPVKRVVLQRGAWLQRACRAKVAELIITGTPAEVRNSLDSLVEPRNLILTIRIDCPELDLAALIAHYAARGACFKMSALD